MENLYENDDLLKVMGNFKRLKEIEDTYIADIEAKAAIIIARAKDEAKKSTEALKKEVFNELSNSKAAFDQKCKEHEERAQLLIKEASEVKEQAESIISEAESKAEDFAKQIIADANKEAESIKTKATEDAKKIMDNAKSESERMRYKARVYLEEAQNIMKNTAKEGTNFKQKQTEKSVLLRRKGKH